MHATGPDARLAPSLNAACQCIWLDRAELAAQLERRLGDAAQAFEGRAGLAAGSVVFVDRDDAASMSRTAALVERALASPAVQSRIEEHAPAIARRSCPRVGGLLGLDFHLGGAVPQLIEINTNPGGLLVNLELAQALRGCCDAISRPLPRLAAGDIPLDEVAARVTGSFLADWRHARGEAALGSVAIVDDDAAQQYLYPEFLLYRRLFERAGWRATVVDAAALELREGALLADGRRIDLVYNRLTDFYLAEERHAVLRRALETDAAVLTPDPAAHAHRADKRLLAWLGEASLLQEAGLATDEIAHLRGAIPPTEIVTRAAAADLWRRRKELFFKPADGYGSKAAYRGDKLTRATFEAVLSRPYVAQVIAPTSLRRVVVEGQQTELKVDVRNYGRAGETWLRAARLYRGQTTNFRTPGGGFAPVLTLGNAG